MNIKKKRLKRWKVGEVRIRKAKGGYGFYCCCGSYTTTRKGDKLKLEKMCKRFPISWQMFKFKMQFVGCS